MTIETHWKIWKVAAYIFIFLISFLVFFKVARFMSSSTDSIYARNLHRVECDGHIWIVSSDGGVVHHPDCPCGRPR